MSEVSKQPLTERLFYRSLMGGVYGALACKDFAEAEATIKALEAENKRLREKVACLETPEWYWGDSDYERMSEDCLWEIIDRAVDDGACKAGTILEVQTGRPLPRIWCLVTKIDGSNYEYQEYGSEAEAKAAKRQRKDDE